MTRIAACLLAVVLLGGAVGCDADPEPRAAATPTQATAAPVTSVPTPSPSTPRCTDPPATADQFTVELDIMSGNPNPRWKLTAAQSRELKDRLLTDQGRIVDVGHGPARLGYRGYIVHVAPSQRAFLERADLGPDFQVAADDDEQSPPTALEDFLASTMPCSALG